MRNAHLPLPAMIPTQRVKRKLAYSFEAYPVLLGPVVCGILWLCKRHSAPGQPPWDDGCVPEEPLRNETLPPAVVRRNIIASAVNSFFVEASMTSSEAGMVLPVFVRALGGSNLMVGLLPSLRFFGWLAPQFYAAGQMQRLTRFLPITQTLEGVRSLFYLLIALTILLLGRTQPGLVLGVFFVLFLITRLTAGSSAVSRAEIIARMVPPHERATVISIRSLSGGVAGFMAGFLVRVVLDERLIAFPRNYALLIGLSGIGFALSIGALAFIREPRVAIKPRTIAWQEQLRRAPALLRGDRRFRLYVGVRAAATGFELAVPFYMLYATELLGAPAWMAGTYISIQTLTRVASNALWGSMCRRRGNLAVLRIACLLGTATPFTVALLPWLFHLLWPQGVPTYAMWLFGLVFLTDGLTISAQGISQMTYLYDIAPDDERPTYFGLTNTLMGPLYFMPALAGAMLDRVGYVPIFVASGLLMGLAYAITLMLKPGAGPPSCQPGAGRANH